ncbi:YdaU family protein [Ferrovibrio sp.]|uniref:YdaU family protein n=1 Tax=Ferrovibrio sp. TaxID=1917215 RepID=UPI0035B3CD0E
MKRADAWMPLYIGDYLADTGRLSTEGHGAYLLLIMDYWRNGPPPDDDDTLAAITKLPLGRWRKMRPVLLSMFRQDGGVWRHKRIDAERDRAAGVTSERSAAGKAGAEARWGKRHGKDDGYGIANAMANASQNDAPSQSQSPKDYPSLRSGGATNDRPPHDQRGSRLPDGWQPSAEARAWAAGEGFPDTTSETAKFCDYWHAEAGQRARKTDWNLAWKVWMRKAFGGQRNHGNPRKHAQSGFVDLLHERGITG